MFHPHDFGCVLDDPVINREGIAGAVHPEKPPFVSQVIGDHANHQLNRRRENGKWRHG